MASQTTPSDHEAIAAADKGWNLPTDIFVEILLRLPPSKRWRLRLVCRHWRDVIRERTPAPAQPTAVAFVVSYAEGTKISASAYAVDDPAGGRCRELWRSNNAIPASHFDLRLQRYVYEETFDTAMVGTCNGVLCLCDNITPGGAIYLVNPATGETLAVPPLPCSGHWRTWRTTLSSWHEAYAFAYAPDTERYKVVHVPSFFDRNAGFDALRVFTPAEGPSTSWRDVPVTGTAASCRLDAGLVCVDGTLHWVTDGTERVVSFDLGAERVASTQPLPARPERGYRWRLAEVHGRLGVVSSGTNWWNNPEKIEVWVLGGGGSDRRQGWRRRYSVQVRGICQRLAAPHFAYGEHVLTMETESNGRNVFAHKVRDAGRRLQCGEVRSLRISEQTPGMWVSGMSSHADGDSFSIGGVFAYVKTTEPLSAYGSQA